jgi:hypothetical protein
MSFNEIGLTTAIAAEINTVNLHPPASAAPPHQNEQTTTRSCRCLMFQLRLFAEEPGPSAAGGEPASVFCPYPVVLLSSKSNQDSSSSAKPRTRKEQRPSEFARKRDPKEQRLSEFEQTREPGGSRGLQAPEIDAMEKGASAPGLFPTAPRFRRKFLPLKGSRL